MFAMKCCSECFEHPWLKNYVVSTSDERGKCSFCGKRNAFLIQTKELSEFFNNLLSMYEEPIPGENIGIFDDAFEDGDLLIDLIQDDWNVFSSRVIESGKAEMLLDTISRAGWDDDDGGFPKQLGELYMRKRVPAINQYWEEFCDVLKINPWCELEFDDFPHSLFEDAAVHIEEGKILFRSRLGYKETNDEKYSFSGSEMGPPPPDRATAGRANEQFKPVLYCADQELTAVAEVRPARGLLISVCDVHVKESLRILDLCLPVTLPNPFLLQNLSYEIEMAEFRVALGKTLGRPLDRSDNPFEYMPTQKLAVYIRNNGFEGIRYPSAMNFGGTNVVIFDISKVEIGKSRLIEVKGIQVEYA